MFTQEQAQRLNQWNNVYGWTVEQCAAAAEEDETLRRLLAVEMEPGAVPDEARAIREQITRIEVCHVRLLANVERILRMIGELQPAEIPGCGEVDPSVAEALRGSMAETAAWIDGRDEDAGALADVLGERTPAKQWLAACLVKTLAQQLEGVAEDTLLPAPEWPE